jgi:NAD(P)-dependent dehydrogenase (short-subunit alcohol dehydrogenase family)
MKARVVMKKVALVTGSNRGIGLELCRQLQRDYQVLACCRNASEDLKTLDVKIVEGIEVVDSSSVEKIQQRLGENKIDLMIHNAGIFRKDEMGPSFEKGIREQFEVNTLAPLRLSLGLVDQMKPESKLVMITSRMGSIADNQSGGYYGYRISKAGLNMAAKSLALDWKSRKIHVALIHPGYVRTEMTGNQGDLDPKEAAEGILGVITTQLTPETSGSFWHSNGERLPW